MTTADGNQMRMSTDPEKFKLAAFFSTVPHEVEEVKSGCRVTQTLSINQGRKRNETPHDQNECAATTDPLDKGRRKRTRSFISWEQPKVLTSIKLSQRFVKFQSWLASSFLGSDTEEPNWHGFCASFPINRRVLGIASERNLVSISFLYPFTSIHLLWELFGISERGDLGLDWSGMESSQPQLRDLVMAF